nr:MULTISPECIES: YciI family protein [unclassified Bradyrhizobium]
MISRSDGGGALRPLVEPRAPIGAPLVLDGPYAETKEQLLGFYIVDCKNLDEALDVARDLG